jgi:type IV fimbrial biogenesis protein FimT
MHRATRKQQRGFNLIELAMVLSITMVALSVSLPLFGSVRAGVQQRTAINQWMSALASARIAAVERGRNIVACPANGDICAPTTFWQDGWIVFEDINRNAQRDAVEPIVLVTPPASDVRIVTTDGRRHIRYRKDGGSEGSNTTITFCDRRGAREARTLVVNNSGRVRSGAATPGQAAIACASG